MGTSAFERFQQETQKPTASAFEQFQREQQAKPDGPGVLSRGLSSAVEGIKNAALHPIDTAENLIVAPVKSAFNAVVAPGVGEARHDARLSKGGNSSGRPIDTSPIDAEHGGITSGERTAAGLQTLSNVAFPSIAGGVGKVAGRAAGLAAAGSVSGATYNPNDPLAGAIAGGIDAPVIGGGLKMAGKAAATVGKGAKIINLASRVRAADPLDEQVVKQMDEHTNANIKNYGDVAAKADAAGGTSQAIKDILADPDVSPYAEMVRASKQGANANDAAVLRTVRKLVSNERRAAQAKNAIPHEYDPQSDLRAGDLGSIIKKIDAAASNNEQVPRNPTTQEALGDFQNRAGAGAGRVVAANELRPQAQADMAREATETPAQRSAREALEARSARTDVPTVPEIPQRTATVPGIMPGLPDAAADLARMKGNERANLRGAQMTRAIARGTETPLKQIKTNSPAAYRKEITTSMTPEQAANATQGSLSQLKREASPTLKQKTVLGAVSALTQPVKALSRTSPFIDLLDQRSGAAKPNGPIRDVLQKLDASGLSLEDVLRAVGVVPQSATSP